MRSVRVIVQMAFLLPGALLHSCHDSDTRACCREAESVDFNDSDTYPVTRGWCVFDDTLCCYSQGCGDSSMSNWTAHTGYAVAYQLRNDSTDHHTVLASPLLEFSQDYCFSATYSFRGNATMDAFLEYSTEDHVVRLIERNSQCPDGDEYVCVAETTIFHFHTSSAGRIKIRAEARGTPNEVRLHAIFLSEGRCEGQSCAFNMDFCDWANKGWTRSDHVGTGNSVVTDAGKFSYLVESQGTLTTPFMTALGPLTVCVTFRYVLWKANTGLNVSVALSDGSFVTVWSVFSSSQGSHRWITGSLPVNVSRAYQIVFTGQQPSSGSRVVALDSVELSPYPSHPPCGFVPSTAATGALLQTTAPTVSPTSGCGSGHPMSSATVFSGSASSTADPGTTGKLEPTGSGATDGTDDDSSPGAAVVGGAVGGGVVFLIVIVAIVVICVCRKRGKRGKPRNQGDTATHIVMPGYDGLMHADLPSQRDENYTEIRNSHFLPSQNDGDYTYVDAPPSRSDVITTSADGFSPPQPAGYDAPPARLHVPSSTTAQECPKPETAEPADQAQDAYSHIRGSKNAPQDNADDDYNHIGNNPQISQHSDHPDYLPAEGESEASPSYGYQLVCRKNQTPAEATRTTREQEELSEMARDEARTRGSTDDACNELWAATTSQGSSGGECPLPKPFRQDPGHYNTLHFDADHRELADDDEHGVSPTPYDRLHSDPDDPYSKIQTGRRNSVMDADYDHLKH